MPDFLGKLVDDARRRVNAGYYELQESIEHEPKSLKRAIQDAEGNAIIAEIKPISPSRGPLRPTIDPVEAAAMLTKGGAVALSVLTEPDNFGGGIGNLCRIRTSTQVPLLMKDIVIDQRQIYAGKKSGADCILLITSAFSNNDANSLGYLIQNSHEMHLEVLLEAHNESELYRALESEADIIGINNRNLATLHIDLNTTPKLLSRVSNRKGKIVITESGLESASDIRKLRQAAVNGFLIGSSIMLSSDLESKVREFVLA
jgi:indole-3-glycerol phosphate synthase